MNQNGAGNRAGASGGRRSGIQNIYPGARSFIRAWLRLDLVTSFSVYPPRLLFVVGVILAACGVLFGMLLLGLRLANGPGCDADGTLTGLGVVSACVVDACGTLP